MGSNNLTVAQRLEELNYDFRHFSMEDFVNWIGKIKNRELLFFAFPMPPRMFGAWVSDEEYNREYFFYRKGVPPIHQVHIQLHEIAHFLCNHETLRVNSAVLAAYQARKVD